MTALADLSDLINRATGGNSGTPENLFFMKTGRVAGAVPTAPILGRPHSLWQYDGQPGGGSAPTGIAVPTNATLGALAQVNPTGGRQKWLYGAWCQGVIHGTFILYDRLLHIGSLSGTSIIAQNVQGTAIPPTVPLTRYTDGIGNQAWVEIHTAIGATATTITMSYTNQSDVIQTSPATTIGGTNFNTAQRIIPLPLAAGDTGIKIVKTVTLAASTTGAGPFGVVIAHPLAYVGIGVQGAAAWRDYTTGLPGIPEIKTDACLAIAFIPAAATVPEIFGGLSMVEA